MWEYTNKVQQHFLHPKNVGEIENPDGIGDVGSLACGDALKLTFKLDEKGVIADAKFKTFGCASAIASSSVLTEMIIGMPLDEAAKVTNEDIANRLGGLPKEKMHCSVMGREALEAAIANYRGLKIPMAEGEVVCECFGVTDLEVIRAIKESSLRSVEEITNFTKAGGGCGKCIDRLREILVATVHQGADIQKVAEKPKRMTTLQKIKKIEEALEREIRPGLRKDGGDIELVDVDGDFVTVSLRGACTSCAKSQTTLKEYVEKKLRELVLDSLIVEESK
ncbi:MAG: Fe-S cluster assembly protein NifU [Proteobacteria bacterium]|nr:Fe-S cluster assembly protein NifU [Desulfocapsa sp.]MBU3944430.1 Fe-S cluster assembly protein NifU [Pseudomonadota bacterium]MCG2744303.1 Fe-S cluster assembly protein NifU [Desulfobacteraceae bacterium]MBU3984247.1 Fe-S cluster assembly protein NifU [Pseudomonadota bacterium]MBU4028719.1 Fe-S cluster assembly protein NifU [Pseudomonadota bacterium]